jgi:hypothetical protein
MSTISKHVLAVRARTVTLWVMFNGLICFAGSVIVVFLTLGLFPRYARSISIIGGLLCGLFLILIARRIYQWARRDPRETVVIERRAALEQLGYTSSCVVCAATSLVTFGSHFHIPGIILATIGVIALIWLGFKLILGGDEIGNRPLKP